MSGRGTKFYKDDIVKYVERHRKSDGPFWVHAPRGEYRVVKATPGPDFLRAICLSVHTEKHEQWRIANGSEFHWALPIEHVRLVRRGFLGSASEIAREAQTK